MTGVEPADDVPPHRRDPVDVDGRAVTDLPTTRPAWKAFAEVRGWRGRVGRPSREVSVRTSDGVRLHARHVEGPAEGPALVLLHGFAARHSKPAYARLADHLSSRSRVLTVDLRGHGRSGGASTLGDLETADVAAAVAWWQDRGAEDVVVVGVSMGATSALLAAARGVPATALVLVSAPAWFEDQPRSPAMQDLQRVWHSATRRSLMHLVGGVRVEAPAKWRDPRHPVEAVTDVDVPLLVVHGEDDHYFPAEDARALAMAAPDATLWLEPPGFGHAEDGLDHAMCRRLTRAVHVWHTTGRFPVDGRQP